MSAVCRLESKNSILLMPGNYAVVRNDQNINEQYIFPELLMTTDTISNFSNTNIVMSCLELD
jgi:hypothetical protein